ncbi:MAG: rod shape-determining protein RodA [Puniceicoccales bacterium]|nr:rod shape-determining protein RodA [Puniceicoccales bacterium]
MKHFNQWIFLTYRHWIGLKRQSTSMMWLNPIILLILSLLGIAFMYAIQNGNVTHLKWKSQVIWLCLGCCVYSITANFNYKIFLQNAHWLYALSILCLLLLWTPFGQTLGGSRRWLNICGLGIQPSDFSKIATLLFVASLLTRTRMSSFLESLHTLVKVAIISGLSFFLIFIQPDLGSAMVLPFIIFSLLFISKLSLRFFIVILGVSLFGLAVIALDTYAYYKQIKAEKSSTHFRIKPFLPLRDYQRKRILAFAIPTSIDPHGVHIGWHLKQSLIAIGSGGILGKGWTKNTQAQLGYLPKAASLNDFIFSVLAEETGLVGSLFVLILYMILILNTFRIATLAKDRFGCYLSVGVAILLLTHVWINIGMTLGIMPITGLPLPFLSYGGSFMLVCFFSQGLVQSVYRFRFAE